MYAKIYPEDIQLLSDFVYLHVIMVIVGVNVKVAVTCIIMFNGRMVVNICNYAFMAQYNIR